MQLIMHTIHMLHLIKFFISEVTFLIDRVYSQNHLQVVVYCNILMHRIRGVFSKLHKEMDSFVITWIHMSSHRKFILKIIQQD